MCRSIFIQFSSLIVLMLVLGLGTLIADQLISCSHAPLASCCCMRKVLTLAHKARVVEWQTRTFEGRMPKGMRVQVPPRAPIQFKVDRLLPKTMTDSSAKPRISCSTPTRD